MVAGHSKWANVKHRKARMDAQKGKVFTKLAREIIVAAREGGGDINSNFRLRLAVQKARENNMPNDNIQRAIQKGAGGLEGESYEQVNYEGYAAGEWRCCSRRSQTTATARWLRSGISFPAMAGASASRAVFPGCLSEKGYLSSKRRTAGWRRRFNAHCPGGGCGRC